MSKPSIVVSAPPRPPNSPLASVKHVIAVGSGKGGVGKSTTAVNLAIALQKLGAKVGLLDADVYGPSVPKLLGVTEKPTEDHEKKKIVPGMAVGIKVMSMGMLSDQAPLVWRGPMASRAITQFLGDVDWGDLDYLIVDMPPGTGDIQLTISQAARLSGAIIVMTPQALASDIAKRGLKMFQQVRIPVIGLVENMSEYECPNCHHVSHLFKKGGADEVSRELRVPNLISIPFDPELVEEGDSGKPVVLSRPDSVSAQRYLELAQRMAAELSTIVSGGRSESATITAVEPNPAVKMVKISWSDGQQSVIAMKELRYICPCAVCVDEATGQRKITRENIKEDILVERVNTVGNYAISIRFSDSHDTGIYSYDYLRRELKKT